MLTQKLKTLIRVAKTDGAKSVWSLLVRRIGERSRMTSGGLVRVGFCYFRCPDEGARSVIIRGVYEAPERFAAKHFVRPDLPVLEFGASIGVVSCLLNRRLRCPQDHAVVEANPEILPVLEENRERNRCRFDIIPGAIGAEGTTARVYAGNGSLGSSLLLRSETYAEVPVLSLAGILKQKGFKRLSLICDIEGAEGQLIRGELSVLRSHVETLVMEFHPAIIGPDEVATLQRLLQENGFDKLWGLTLPSECVSLNRPGFED